MTDTNSNQPETPTSGGRAADLVPGHLHENHGEDWRAIYDGEQVWSGNANVALVAVMNDQLAELPAGRALDVGCGEGADAVYLAQRGWNVTALDVAAPALERGRGAAEAAGGEVAERIEWVQSGLLEAALAPGSFNLVSVFYPALRRTEEKSIEASLREFVAPGGLLLMVAHAFVDRERALEHGFDPDDYVTGDDVVAQLGEGWEIERFEAERNVTEGRGAHHHADIVIIARRDAVA